jgi:hypothetical protein
MKLHKYKYKMDGIRHTIHSQEPIPNAVGNVIPISKAQNKIANQLKELLREWIRVTEANDIVWFANGGTALGGLRDGGLIHFDNDIDVAVFLKDFLKVKNLAFDTKYKLDYCEQGFQLHFAGQKFPFIDVFILGQNPNDPSRIIIAAPVFDNGDPTYIGHMIWPNDNYSVKDIANRVKIPFEDLFVYVPRNAEMYLKQMYGDDCMTRYVVQKHTDNHEIWVDNSTPEQRTKFAHFVRKLDPKSTNMSNLIFYAGALFTNAFATSDRNKTKRFFEITTRHICERYLGVKPPFGV